MCDVSLYIDCLQSVAAQLSFQPITKVLLFLLFYRLESEQGAGERASVDQVAKYYEAYVRDKNLDGNFMNNCLVTSVEKVPVTPQVGADGVIESLFLKTRFSGMQWCKGGALLGKTMIT